MVFSRRILAAAIIGTAFLVPAAHAREDMDADKFVKMCDTDKDGMVSKAEMMKMVEKVWAKADTKKMGKIDKAQVEFFLKELMKAGG
jgi:arginine deiminase